MKRKMHKTFFILSTFLVVCFSSIEIVKACSCLPSNLQESVEETPNIIVAKMQSVEKARSNEKNYDEERIKHSNFIVQKVYKGNLKVGQILKFTQGICCNCVMAFSEEMRGTEFLFYLGEKAGKKGLWLSSVCSRSGLAWKNGDIKYLERLQEVKGKTRLFGRIIQEIKSPIKENPSTYKRLENHIIKIVGNGKEIELKTDNDGFYEIYDLPVGKYKVLPQNLDGFKPFYYDFVDNIDEIEINAGKLEEVNIRYRVDNLIGGKFLDEYGRPLEKVSLRLLPSYGKKAQDFLDFTTTSKNGEFQFKGIPIGTYFLIANEENLVTATNPFETFFYPNSKTKENAKLIEINAGEYLTDLILTAPSTAERVIISGIVLSADGKPMDGVYVKFFNNISDNAKIESYKNGDSSSRTDENGKFTMKILKGQKGVLYGETGVYKKRVKGCNDLEKLIKKSGKDYHNLKTLPIQISAIDNISEVQLKFEFNKCKETK